MEMASPALATLGFLFRSPCRVADPFGAVNPEPGLSAEGPRVWSSPCVARAAGWGVPHGRSSVSTARNRARTGRRWRRPDDAATVRPGPGRRSDGGLSGQRRACSRAPGVRAPSVCTPCPSVTGSNARVQPRGVGCGRRTRIAVSAAGREPAVRPGASNRAVETTC